MPFSKSIKGLDRYGGAETDPIWIADKPLYQLITNAFIQTAADALYEPIFGFSTYFNQAVKTTSSPTFNGLISNNSIDVNGNSAITATKYVGINDTPTPNQDGHNLSIYAGSALSNADGGDISVDGGIGVGGGKVNGDVLIGQNSNAVKIQILDGLLKGGTGVNAGKVTAVTEANYLNSNVTLSSLGAQPQLNGTGFVKATGTTISYDNSTYYKANDNVTLGTIGCGAITGTSSAQLLDTAGLILKGATYKITLSATTATSDKTITIPNATGTLPLLESNNTWTGTNKINVNSTTALFVEQDGVMDNTFIVDTTKSYVGVNIVPTQNFQVNQGTNGIGTVSNSAGGTYVTGTGTRFLSTFKLGDTITIGGQTVTITWIDSDTGMWVGTAITNANTNVAYTLVGGIRFMVRGNGEVDLATDAGTRKMWTDIVFNGGSSSYGRLVWVGGSKLYEQNGGDFYYHRMLYQPVGSRFEVLNAAGTLFIASFIGDDNAEGANAINFWQKTTIGETSTAAFKVGTTGATVNTYSTDVFNVDTTNAIVTVAGEMKATTYRIGTDAGIDMASGTPKGLVVKKGIVTAATSVTPAADNTYANPTSITISGGIITAIS